MEMDIYMRRRLVALGGLVAFFIIVVLLIKSCGGDDEEPVPLATTPTTGTTGAVGTVLTTEQFIATADDICEEANSAVGALDPTDPDAVQEEYQITSEEYQALTELQLEEPDRQINRFLGLVEDVVQGLRAKQRAVRAGDTVASDEAQLQIDTAEAEARELGETIGFADCGQWLDAGQAPRGGNASTDTSTDTGTVAPTDTSGGVTPPTDTGIAPPTDTGTPPVDGTTPPPDDSGGITP